jgi:hypothetical protein
MALNAEQIEFIKQYAYCGAKSIAEALGIKYSTVVNVAHRHRISLKTEQQLGRPMAIDIMPSQRVYENKPIVEAIRYELWLKKEYMGKQVLWSAEWKKQRLRVLKRDGYMCAYCGQDATEVDHIIARAKGGGHDLDNLVACCKRCNGLKGAMSEGSFLAQKIDPPVLMGNISPTQSKPPQTSPFKILNNPSQ